MGNIYVNSQPIETSCHTPPGPELFSLRTFGSAARCGAAARQLLCRVDRGQFGPSGAPWGAKAWPWYGIHQAPAKTERDKHQASETDKHHLVNCAKPA